MNCRMVQQEMAYSLAAGSAALPPQISAHRDVCEECRSFFEAQQKLFTRLDSALHNLVNQPVPPSLVPGIRLRLDEPSSGYFLWAPRWILPAVATAAVIILGLALVRNFSSSRRALPEVAATASRGQVESVGKQPVRRAPTGFALKPAPRRSVTRVAGVADPAAEVIVLAEERDAFARYVASHAARKSLPVAAGPAAPPQQGKLVEIALLQIDDIAVKSLESENGH